MQILCRDGGGQFQNNTSGDLVQMEMTEGHDSKEIKSIRV